MPGGVHALLVEGGALTGHASAVQRRMLHGGQALRPGYTEGVAVHAARRRRGHGAALMSALKPIMRAGRGAHPGRYLRPPDKAGTVYVLPVPVPVGVSGELVCDWRPGSVW